MVDTLLVLGAIAFAVVVCICVLLAWALVRTVRGIRRRAGRVSRRVQTALPVGTFGNQVWWVAGRLDRIEEQADYAATATARSVLGDEVQLLAAELHAATASVRDRLRAVQALSGPQRTDEVQRLEPTVAELEAGAAQLRETAALLNSWDAASDGIGTGEHVRRRAATLAEAVAELQAVQLPPDLPDLPLPTAEPPGLAPPTPEPPLLPRTEPARRERA